MRSFRLLAYAMLAIAIGLIASPATHAQSLETVPSIDENGVDLSTVRS